MHENLLNDVLGYLKYRGNQQEDATARMLHTRLQAFIEDVPDYLDASLESYHTPYVKCINIGVIIEAAGMLRDAHETKQRCENETEEV